MGVHQPSRFPLLAIASVMLRSDPVLALHASPDSLSPAPGKVLSTGRKVLHCRGAVSLGVLFVQEGWRAQALGCGYPSVIVCLPWSCWVWKQRSGSICLKFKSQLG